jgi:hypothetical protein
MIKRKLFLSFLFFITGYTTSFAQLEYSKKRTATRASVKADTVFSKSFIGNWKGTLQWMIAGKPTRPFTIRLNIQPSDTAGQYIENGKMRVEFFSIKLDDKKQSGYQTGVLTRVSRL